MKNIIIALIGLALLAAALAGIKALQIGAMMASAKNNVPPPEVVTTARVTAESWETTLGAVGTLTAVLGVTVSAELPGKVTKIAFESGSAVKKGDLLLTLDTSTEEAGLPGAVAQEALARANRERAERMLAEGIASRADYDSAVAVHEEALSRVKTIRAAIDKKTIRAPFSGRAGIRLVDPGQFLREGDPIVSLQKLDRIHADFTLPQQELPRLASDLPVRLTSDAIPGETFMGRINALDSKVDEKTRNIKVQATFSNPGERLRPGMFVSVAVLLPERPKVLAIPQTGVLYAPYGDSVFIIEENPQKAGELRVRQQFVRLGERRGDFVAVTSGLSEGQKIVSTGVFKLRNGQTVTEDNRLAPTFELDPRPENT